LQPNGKNGGHDADVSGAAESRQTEIVEQLRGITKKTRAVELSVSRGDLTFVTFLTL
jgi:hypothetical protein